MIIRSLLTVSAALIFSLSSLASAASDPMFDRGVSAAFGPAALFGVAGAGAPVPPVSGLPVPGTDTVPQGEQEPAELFGECGPFGIWCPDENKTWIRPHSGWGPRAVLPLRGFSDLGPAGSQGEIDGPMSRGNGDYKVLAAEPYRLSLWIKTGYIRLTMTLDRDPSGRRRDIMTTKGWAYKGGKWVNADGQNAVSLSYDAGKDSGRIAWSKDGRNESEGFWGGEGGDRRAMTIEFGGGYNHDFKRK